MQVRCIFAFPTEFGNLAAKHFALVELFTKFTKSPQAESGFFSISRLSKNRLPVSKVVPISDIHFSCQLAPKVIHASDITWSSDQALNKCATFYLNTDASRRLWALAKGFMAPEGGGTI